MLDLDAVSGLSAKVVKWRQQIEQATLRAEELSANLQAKKIPHSGGIC